MSDVKTPSSYSIDIPQDAVEAAVASVEKHTTHAEPAQEGAAATTDETAVSVEVPVEVPAAAAPAPAPAAPPKKTPQDAIIEALIRGKQEATEVLAQTQKEAKDLLEARARIQAEFENYKKRVGKEKLEAQAIVTQKLCRELLPVVDNFERTIQHADVSKMPDDAKNIVTGVVLVAKQFQDALKKVGVDGFSSKGKPFDPARHEAVSQMPAPEGFEPGQVVEELQRGYMLGELLLRPALVVVAGPREG